MSDPGWARVRCPDARSRVAHASVPGGPFVRQSVGGFVKEHGAYRRHIPSGHARHFDVSKSRIVIVHLDGDLAGTVIGKLITR